MISNRVRPLGLSGSLWAQLTVIDVTFSFYAWNGFLIFFLYLGESQNNPAFSLQEVLVGSSSIERTIKKITLKKGAHNMSK